VALLLPRKLIATCTLVRLSSEAMVNSPSTSATVRNAAESTAERMLGSTTRHITVAQLRAEAAGGLGERADVDRGEPGVDRAIGVGQTRIVYAKVSVSDEPPRK
jgi:hypothetical protein